MDSMLLGSDHFSCLNPIQYEKFQIQHLDFHQVSIALHETSNVVKLYEKFAIYLPEKIKNAGLKRKSEFLIGRLAAQYALKSLNYSSDFILQKGQYGEPVWPSNYFGSISHSMAGPSTGIAVAYLNQGDKYAGIDLELTTNSLVLNHNQDILKHFLNTYEIQYLFHFNQLNPYFYLIAFSAKESIIKAICSKYQIILPFSDIQLTTVDLVAKLLFFKITNFNLNDDIRVNYAIREKDILTYCLI